MKVKGHSLIWNKFTGELLARIINPPIMKMVGKAITEDMDAVESFCEKGL